MSVTYALGSQKAFKDDWVCKRIKWIIDNPLFYLFIFQIYFFYFFYFEMNKVSALQMEAFNNCTVLSTLHDVISARSCI